MLGRVARLLLGRGTTTTAGSRGCLQQVRSKADGSSSSPSSPIGRVQSELAALYQSIDREVGQHYTNDQGMGSFSQRAAQTLKDMQAAMKAAAAQRPGSSDSSSSNISASSVGPSLLHYADLLGRYNSCSASQRRQLLEGLQMQLLPRVNVMVGLPVPNPPPTSSSPLPEAQHSRSSSRSRASSRRPAPAHPAVAASGVVDQQQQQQQHRGPGPLKRAVGPRRGSPAPETQRQPSQSATEQQHVANEQSQPQQQQQQQQQQQELQLESVEQQPPSSAAAGASFQQGKQQQPGLPDQPQQQQQQDKVVRRRVGPPRSPGPPRRSSSLMSATPTASDSSAAQAAAEEQPAQSVQSQQQLEQQQQQQQAGLSQPHMGGRGPHTARGPMRMQSAPHSTMQPPGGPGAAPTPTPPAAEQAAQASPQQQSQQQQSQVQPTPEANPSSSSSSSSRARGPIPARPLLRSASANGPYPPRRHSPYPPAATQAELMRLHQQQRQQQQQQGLLPAWQLYWPLPEELGGPARPPPQQQPVAAAAPAAAPTDDTAVLQHQLEQLQLQVSDPAAAPAAAAAADAALSSESESDTDEAEAAGSSSRKRGTRDKALTEQKWQALVASARRHHEHLQQEQQRQQQEAAGELKQRTGSWFRLREGRLTGSALANMLSWFDGQDRADHVRLWREKLGLQKPPPPNEKMLYGTCKEHHALSSYQQLAPQEMLQEMGFALWGTDGAHDWLAGSPDGLITSAGLEGLSSAAAAAAAGDAVGVSEEVAAWVKQQTGSSLEGVLEIKCPYKASPQASSPFLPRKMDPYYMPQVQVLCEVLEREWAVVYYWSEGQGSHMTLVHRDRDYFGLLWRAMADFWWRHLVPAKLLLEADPSATDTIERMYTPRVHPYRAEIIRRSKAMVGAAPQRTFTAEQTVGHMAQPAADTAAATDTAAETAAAAATDAPATDAPAAAAAGI